MTPFDVAVILEQPPSNQPRIVSRPGSARTSRNVTPVFTKPQARLAVPAAVPVKRPSPEETAAMNDLLEQDLEGAGAARKKARLSRKKVGRCSPPLLSKLVNC